MYTVVRNFIRNGESVLWVGVERSLPLAESMGLRKNGQDVDNFRYVDVSYYDELQKVTDAWLKSEKYRWMVIDSLTAVCPSPEKMKDDLETISIGLDARIQAKFMRLYHALIKKYNKSIIFITQSRMQIGIRPGEVTKEHAAGGKATQFYSDIRFTVMGNINVNSSSTLDGGRDYIAGKSGYLIAEKIRHAPPLVKIPVTILFGKGLSNVQALCDYAQWRGIVTGLGGWYTCTLGGEHADRIQGKNDLLNWIKNNSEAVLADFYAHAEEYFQCLQAADGKKPYLTIS
jgi:RecA/RadA recombinase